MENKRSDQMKLGLFVNQGGHHEAAWRLSDTPCDAGLELAYYKKIACISEACALHFLFFADSAGVKQASASEIARAAGNDGFEPLTLLAALTGHTQSIGLVTTASTTFNSPYDLARKFASLDHLSGGRVGWNVVTSANPFEAQNFGSEPLPDHDERYQRAMEFVDVARGLWDSWGDDAFIRDKASGVFADTMKMHVLDHHGRFFTSRGPLNIARSPQGYPVLVQAGNSQAGLDFAAHFGEVIFTAERTVEGAQNIYRSIKDRAKKYGRPENSIVVMPGVVPIVGKTEEEAHEKLRRLQDLTHPDIAIGVANRLLGFVTDLKKFDMDAPMPSQLAATNNLQSRQKMLLELVARERLTVRQFLNLVTVGRGHLLLVGSPQQIADHLLKFFNAYAADGFNILPPVLPQGLQDFAEMVIPELRSRAAFRLAYEPGTLRDNLGLARPSNQFGI
ncbi:LLM class flavin-dependent oxidoreductase [Rhizobium mongolense]|uniref:LLM class flavin-dependent oxidoreductase n=1 Tax=Rhizobium mongolense TaxID=57676 RepID=UPI003557F7C4